MGPNVPVLTSSLPEVGKLIPQASPHSTPQASNRCSNNSTTRRNINTGIAGLQHILSTLLTHGTTRGTPHNGPWIGFLDHATKNLTPQLTNTLRPY